MKRKCLIHKNFDTEEYYLKIEDLLEGTSIKVSDVVYYQFEFKDDLVLLTLYDSNQNPINIVEKKEKP